MPSGAGISSGSLHKLDDEVGADVRREQDDRVLEVDAAPLAVLHPSLVEHLEEQLVHIGVRLLDLVEQHHAVRAGGARPRSGRRLRRSRHIPAASP